MQETHDQMSAETQPAGVSELDAQVEAVLLASPRPISASAISAAIAGTGRATESGEVESAIARINHSLDSTGRAARVERVAGGYRLMTRSEFAPVLASIRLQQVQAKLSRAAIETLAIIAYKQPIARADLESIRGVACGEVLRSLMDRRMVAIVGRAEEPGRPMLYGTTREFLDQFGLGSLKDLPAVDAGANP
ncbi:MAG: SMC-Scp complex subunit ScpB [Phycisphaeraceae bacterium]|nr:SMC-Scp complex subunit ScpB [Phycisphaeraceae bacterium]MCW5767161.1 SMC-Scp complex subunit ScpB [Phycisphaeraceae bacterium]